MQKKEPWKIVYLFAFTLNVAYGTLYYAFAILGPEIQRETGWRTEIVFGAFSWSLLVAGLVATPAGVLIDRFGGRWVMGTGSLLAGIGLIGIGIGHSVGFYFASWTVVGLGMAAGLYEAAFATINREFQTDSRKGISVLTLFAGFASTIFWPLTLQLNNAFGWRTTWIIYGAIHLALCAPLHAMLRAGARHVRIADSVQAVRDFTLKEALRDAAFWKLAFAFATNMFIFSALSVHLIPLLQRLGHSTGAAVMVAALIGPMQVAGRLGEMAVARRVQPQTIGKLTFAMLPAALLAVLFFGQHQTAAAVFCMLYGMSNGILTIVRGTVPQALFGRENYGAIAGALAGPTLIAKAAGPLAVAALIEFDSSPALMLGSLLVISAVSLACFVAALNAKRAENTSPITS